MSQAFLCDLLRAVLSPKRFYTMEQVRPLRPEEIEAIRLKNRLAQARLRQTIQETEMAMAGSTQQVRDHMDWVQ